MHETTTFMLLYGDYSPLHLRTLTRFFANVPKEVYRRFWLNAVCPSTLAWLVNRLSDNMVIYINDENRPKYKAMRLLLHDPHHIIETPWITWFDDDALIVKPDWYKKTVEFAMSEKCSNIAFFGQQRRKGHQPGIRKFVRQSEWFTGRKFQRIKGEAGSRYHGPGIVFIQGSYWWLRTDAMIKLDWPDPRLSHNGGDTLLSEAVWQQRYRQVEFYYGIEPNSTTRRGLSENPAGFKYTMISKTDAKPASMVGSMPEYKQMLKRLDLGWVQEDAHTLVVDANSIGAKGSFRVPLVRASKTLTNKEIVDKRRGRGKK